MVKYSDIEPLDRFLQDEFIRGRIKQAVMYHNEWVAIFRDLRDKLAEMVTEEEFPDVTEMEWILNDVLEEFCYGDRKL